MARVVVDDFTLWEVIAELTADGDIHLRRHPRTQAEIGQDAASDLGLPDDLAPGEHGASTPVPRIDQLFEDFKILQVQNALLWMRQRDRVGQGVRRDYAFAAVALLIGLLAWLAGLATWDAAPISMFAFMAGVALITLGSYRWRASSWLGRGLITRDFWLSARVAFFVLFSAALSFVTLALGPWSLPSVLRLSSAGIGLTLVYLGWRALERGNSTTAKRLGPSRIPV
jgi:hypothetical protein